jgi:hypothetical protein
MPTHAFIALILAFFSGMYVDHKYTARVVVWFKKVF